ncbi:SDR family oxidoreductase [Agilicoccus flavus]|uniref:SDR family oxidoreductase n=1 Tax=Agilicoccus flavus TaxID=2775968 RepID=UPI001CF6C4E6|nr:SDR family oxidoreductase [Agilicoccus flavus]
MSATKVVVVTGAGSMGVMIARRVGQGRTLLFADIDPDTLAAVQGRLSDEGYDVATRVVDTSDHDSVRDLARAAAELGDVEVVVHTAGVSPNMADPATIAAVDLAGTAFVLEEFGAIIADGGAGLVISSQAAHMSGPLPDDVARSLAHDPSDALVDLPVVAALEDSGAAYVLAKLGNNLRVQAQSVLWGDRGARLNSLSPGIISTPLAQHELSSPDAAGDRDMLENCAAGRMGTPTEVAEIAALLLGPNGRYFSGSDLLIDGGVIAGMRAGRIGAYRSDDEADAAGATGEDA